MSSGQCAAVLLLGLITNSIQPIPRFSVQVGNGNNQDFGLEDLIADAIRKASRLASAGVCGERMPRFRKLLESFERTQHFNQKLIAEACGFSIVILDCFVKLLLRDVKKSDFHLPAIFCEDICEGNRLQFSGLVRLDPILDFLAP